jgi:hypothetical protein
MNRSDTKLLYMNTHVPLLGKEKGPHSEIEYKAAFIYSRAFLPAPGPDVGLTPESFLNSARTVLRRMQQQQQKQQLGYI